MTGDLLAATGALALLTVLPGPDMALVTSSAVASGTRDALRTVSGIATGLLAWGALAVAGLAAVLAASAGAYLAVKLAGAAYLVLLGVRALRRRPTETPARPAATGHPWRTGLVSNVLNPKIAVFYTGLLPTLAPSELPPVLGMSLLVALHAALTIGWLSAYTYAVARARASLSHPRARQILDRVTGATLIALGVKVATT
ncbi:LysE family translocator [Streptomyces sp. G45]|uniref:LysE family translocator n=1 Tax=Streptomyces sp. G45 TaxID=3406627 RepID=UPI003C2207A6